MCYNWSIKQVSDLLTISEAILYNLPFTKSALYKSSTNFIFF